MKNLFSMKSALNKIYSSSEADFSSVEEKQKELLVIYKDVFDACERHGLRLFLQGGTLLGKIRHNGFIPWDDDMDLGLSRKDYEKLPEVYHKELEQNYILFMPGSSEGSRTRFAQIFKRDDTGSKRWIDIFPIDYAPKSRFYRIIKGIRCNLFSFIGGSIEFIDGCSEHTKSSLLETRNGKINYYIRKVTRDIFCWIPIQKWYVIIDNSVHYEKETPFCTSALGRWHYFGEMQADSVFFPLNKTMFCGFDAWVPNNANEYLRHNYGSNYMEIPPLDKRETHAG